MCIRDRSRSVRQRPSSARARRAVDAYIFCELLTEARRCVFVGTGRTESVTLLRIGDFVDRDQNSSQDDLSLQQAGGSRAPPLDASTTRKPRSAFDFQPSYGNARIRGDLGARCLRPVSYTHLDVYKRQIVCHCFCANRFGAPSELKKTSWPKRRSQIAEYTRLCRSFFPSRCV